MIKELAEWSQFRCFDFSGGVSCFVWISRKLVCGDCK